MAKEKVVVVDSGKASKQDIDAILKEAGIKKYKVDGEILDMIKVGCELCYLSKEDVVYMASQTSYWEAQRRLTARRLGK